MMDSSEAAAMDFNLLAEEDESGNDCKSRQEDGDEEEEEGDNEDIELLEVTKTLEEQEEQEEHEQEEGNEEVHWRRPSSKILTFPAHAPIQADTTTFSSREPTLLSVDTDVEMEVTTEETPSPSTTPNRRSDSTAAGDHGKSPSVATPGGSSDDRPSSNSSEESSLQSHHKRFLELQAFLKLCDEADQKDLLEALRSLSAAARSGHAFNLEYRALMLSMEEGREMLRLKMLNVMGGKGSPSQSQQDNGSTPLGTRLPAPGSVTDLSAY
ncbi:histone H3.v1 [Selaginella moellendorffii]|nr:histone H3.v1 [Selaginella moellendorffii]|eukprot:XP_002982151.2 histone H3.v1 [Selaginella moellendorffii]